MVYCVPPLKKTTRLCSAHSCATIRPPSSTDSMQKRAKGWISVAGSVVRLLSRLSVKSSSLIRKPLSATTTKAPSGEAATALSLQKAAVEALMLPGGLPPSLH